MPHTLGHKMGIHTFCLGPQAYCPNALFYIYQTINLNSDLHSSHLISTFYSSLENLLQKKPDCKISAKIFCAYFRSDAFKENLHNFSFLEYTFTFCKFCKYFCTFEFAWSRPFQKCIIFHISINFSFFCTLLLNN